MDTHTSSTESVMKTALAMVQREDQIIREFVERYSFAGREERILRALSAKRAAGPDLYEALCDLVDAASEGDPRKHPQWDARYAAAVAAIHRAEDWTTLSQSEGNP